MAADQPLPLRRSLAFTLLRLPISKDSVSDMTLDGIFLAVKRPLPHVIISFPDTDPTDRADIACFTLPNSKIKVTRFLGKLKMDTVPWESDSPWDTVLSDSD